MKNILFPVLFTTTFLVIYAILPSLGAGLRLMVILFVISQFLVIWMVIRVLKDGKPSGKKFSDGVWYEDSSYRANLE